MADNREQSAAWDSEKKLDTEEKSLIGDEAEDRNLTGSTTYVTLPDQSEQSDKGSDQGSNKQSQNSGNSSGSKSSDNNRGGKRS